MNKTEIMNTYAIEQGYEDYDDLIHSADDLEDIIYHFDNVTDLIQEELKKKIKKCVKLKVFDGEKTRYGKEFEMNKVIVKVSSKSILNTEIL